MRAFILGFLLTTLFVRANNVELYDILNGFSYKNKTVAKDLAVIKANVKPSVRIIPQLLGLKGKTVIQKLELMVLLGQLQRKDSKGAREAAKVLAGIASDSKADVKLRRQSARTVQVDQLAAKEVWELVNVYIGEAAKGKSVISPVLESMPGKHVLPHPMVDRLLSALPKVALSCKDGSASSYTDLCRRVAPKKTPAVLLKLMTMCNRSPRTVRDIWDTHLTDEERQKMAKVYMDYLTGWVTTGVVTKPDDILSVGKGYEKPLLGLLIHNLKSDNPHARVDAAIALRELCGRTFGYNPAGSKSKREEAIAKWQEFSRIYKPKRRSKK